MEDYIYLTAETMSALVILILIFANNFGIKQRSKKRNLFNGMLAINEVIVLSDAVTYFPGPWDKISLLHNVLMVLTFSLPSLFKMCFSSYLHVHIAAKTSIRKTHFIFLRLYCLAEFLIVFLLCISGKMFRIEGAEYYSGPAETVYLAINILSVLVFAFVVFKNEKKLGPRDTIAVMPFIIIPFLATAIHALTGFDFMVTMLAFHMLFMYVTLQSENESYLYTRANIDELTGVYNRTAYMEELEELKKSANDSLVYASVDLNGLKPVNDSLGHAAGDELIIGAAHCLKKAFGGAGKVYRMGGDEFAAIFFTDGANFKFEILRDALTVFTGEWKGKISDSLTLSVGYASRKEFPDEDIKGLSKIADQRMYEEKRRYYADKGTDRRGQSGGIRV